VTRLPLSRGRFRVLARPIDGSAGPGTLLLGKNLDDVEESVRILTISLSASVPLVLTALGLLVWFLTGRVLRPVESVRADVASIQGDQLHRRVPVPGTNDEISRLVTTMNGLLERVEQAAERQRVFVADASHELRGPLTRLRADVEVALAHPDASGPAPLHRRLLVGIVELQQLVDDLLFLARSESGSIGGPIAVVDLDDLVLAEARLLRQRGRVHVNTSAISAARTRGDSHQLARAISNLASNAERHARTAVDRRVAAHPDLVALSGGQHTELMAIGIGHHHPADLALTDVDSSRPEGDETVDLRLLITVDRWSEIEMQPVLPGLRVQWRAAPADLRTAVRRADRGLLVLVPDQRPAQRLAPEVPDLLRTVTRQRSDKPAVGKEVVAWLDDAELIALGVGEHDMLRVRTLTDVDVPGAESERPCHRLLLVLQRRARQIEMHLVRAGLLLLGQTKVEPEPGVIVRQERDHVVGVVGDLPAQDAGPKPRETGRVVRIEAEREEVRSHPAPHLRSADSQPQPGTALPAQEASNARRPGTLTQRK
jgi:HAMP domain-containing protein